MIQVTQLGIEIVQGTQADRFFETKRRNYCFNIRLKSVVTPIQC